MSKVDIEAIKQLLEAVEDAQVQEYRVDEYRRQLYRLQAQAPALLAQCVEEIERLRAGLSEIAKFNDEQGNRQLARDGKYHSFDEPCSVQAARRVLRGCTDVHHA